MWCICTGNYFIEMNIYLNICPHFIKNWHNLFWKQIRFHYQIEKTNLIQGLKIDIKMWLSTEPHTKTKELPWLFFMVNSTIFLIRTVCTKSMHPETVCEFICELINHKSLIFECRNSILKYILRIVYSNFYLNFFFYF